MSKFIGIQSGVTDLGTGIEIRIFPFKLKFILMNIRGMHFNINIQILMIEFTFGISLLK